MPVSVMFRSRQVGCPRQCIVHEGAAQHLAGLRIVHRVLQHRLADALRHAALHLADRQHRIDQRAEIIHRGVAVQRDGAGVGIDLHFRDMAAVREGDDVEQVPDIGVQTWRMPSGRFAGSRAARATASRSMARSGSLRTVNRPSVKTHLLRRCLQQPRGDRGSLRDDIVSTALHNAAPPMCMDRAPPWPLPARTSRVSACM